MDDLISRQATIRFPMDCSRNCPHFRTWDMSVDDWTNVCDLLNVQVDDCDMDNQWMICPNNGADMRGE